ncbi:MAG: glycosyltransferase family A protein [Oscillospiraceae bacterium]|nr:glycosyltransferase family A protein [Oscillospiraceae bacterium]
MNSDIQVSIICNTYNQESYIRDALEGFVMQKTDFNFEVLVHDDASTDKTADIIREYEKKYPELIKPIYQTVNQHSQNIKINVTYQIPRMKGKYAAPCEGDDYWTDPLKLQKQYDFMESHKEYSMCACAATWRNMRDNIDEDQFIIDSDKDVSLSDLILETNGRIFPTVSVFIKKELYADYPTWRLLFPVGDLAFFMIAGMNGKIRMLSDNMCVYRWHAAGSWTNSMENEEKKKVFKRKFIKAFEELNQATDLKYNDLISERLKKEKFDLAVLEHDWKKIKSDELKDIVSSMPLKTRTAIFVKCRLPWLFRILSGDKTK